MKLWVGLENEAVFLQVAALIPDVVWRPTGKHRDGPRTPPVDAIVPLVQSYGLLWVSPGIRWSPGDGDC